MGGGRRGRKAGAQRPEPGYTFEQLDELNERYFAEGRGVSRSAAWKRFAEVERLVERIGHDRLNEPGLYSWLPEDVAFGYFVAGNTFGHYEEHISILHGEPH